MSKESTREEKRQGLNVVRTQLLAMGFNPQCDGCKHFDLEIGTCAVGLDSGKYYDSMTDCPKLDPNQGEDQ